MVTRTLGLDRTMNEQNDRHSSGPLVSAFRVYFVADSDAVERFIAEPPDPWQAYGDQVCKVAVPNANAFKEWLYISVWAEELGEHESKDDLENALLKEIKERGIAEYVVEDVSKFAAERERLEKIRIGLRKSVAPTPSPLG